MTSSSGQKLTLECNFGLITSCQIMSNFIYNSVPITETKELANYKIYQFAFDIKSLSVLIQSSLCTT